jgi:ketosteroid isomerase-like protein
MKTITLVGAALVCVGCSTKAPSSKGDSDAPATATLAGGALAHDSATDRHAIDQVRERELTTLRNYSTQSASDLYTDDVVVMPPDEKAVVGRDSVVAWFKNFADQFNLVGSYPQSRIVINGDLAVEQYVGELTMTPKKGGKPAHEHFKGIHIYRRQPDGSWRIMTDIWNSDQAPAANKPH